MSPKTRRTLEAREKTGVGPHGSIPGVQGVFGDQQEGFGTFAPTKPAAVRKTGGPGSVFKTVNLSQQQFGQSFGGGNHALDDEVNPQSSERMQMASASGASYPQMNYAPHQEHQNAHKPRTDTFNRMQSNPPDNVFVAGSPFEGQGGGGQFQAGGQFAGNIPPAQKGHWPAAAPRLQAGGDDRTYHVTETTNNLMHPQSGIGGNAERDRVMREKTIPINLSGVSVTEFQQGHAAEQRAKEQRDRTVAAAMGGASELPDDDIEMLEGTPAPAPPAPAPRAPTPPAPARQASAPSDKESLAGFQPPELEHTGDIPEPQSGATGEARDREIQHEVRSRPISLRDDTPISLDRGPEEQKSAAITLPSLDEFAPLDEGGGGGRKTGHLPQ